MHGNEAIGRELVIKKFCFFIFIDHFNFTNTYNQRYHCQFRLLMIC
jgi:hypothetical protein